MALAWNEIRDRARTFSHEWAHAESEDAEAKPFWIDFFNVFGITSRRIGSFEKRVKKLDGKDGYIDWLWKGNLLIEHKSRGKNLDRAYQQAIDYFPGLKEHELPRFVLVCDFARFRLYDLEEGEQTEFPLKDLHKHIKLFWFIAGYQPQKISAQSPVNAKAVQRMAKLHDRLKKIGYTGHALEVYLVRLLFCLFAEDTGIFERTQFAEFIENQTRDDGADLAAQLAQLFEVLNTPEESRLKNLDESISRFPYVNGKLFEERLPLASFDSEMRDALLFCCALDWSEISPAIFGSLFQNIMDETPNARRNLGAHYTTEENILKLIRPLFLDDLHAEFGRIKNNVKRLQVFHQKLSGMNFFDPACGCGNFLVIAYRELRLLELKVLRAIHDSGQQYMDISHLVQIDVDQFHGIEIEEFPSQIAQVALWLTDHQMNARISEEFGKYFVRLPLKKSPHIIHGNALRTDWNEVVPATLCSYLMGNPPFLGKKEQSPEQKHDVETIFHDTKNAGLLDYVSCWYRKAADYMVHNPAIHAAFVSTNSITQGEQVGVLWPDLLKRGVHINFAHRTFAWSSEAIGKAAVHCVIIGFGLENAARKSLFEYADIKGDPHEVSAKNINPYLVDAPSVLIVNRNSPISNAPEINYGSFALDDGNFTLSESDREEILAQNPGAEKFIKQFVGGQELLHNTKRWCIWLVDAQPNEIRSLPAILSRVEAVKEWREKSNRATTKKLAGTPTRFAEIRQPKTNYIAIPTLSSENRNFIPISFLDAGVIASNQIYVLPNASLFHFGILHSTMHNAWMRTVCGRLESRYRYSAGIVYNNFPWPEPTDKQRGAIEAAAQVVLDTRFKFPDSTLADLYDPLTMPSELSKAHAVLDRAVDAAYGKKSFASEAERVALLFERYQSIISLLPTAPSSNKGAKRKVESDGTDDPGPSING